MILADVFVGSVAVVLGVLAVAAAAGNWDRCYQFAKIRWLESMAGRGVARAAYAAVGVALILLGVAIALGFGPNKSRRSFSDASPAFGRYAHSPPGYRLVRGDMLA